MRLARPMLAILGTLASFAGPVAAGTASETLSETDVQRLRGYQARQWEGIRLLDGVSRSLPELLWLDRLTVSPEQILIEGKAFNTNAIANFIENLDRLPDFTEPTLLGVSEEPDKTYSFSLTPCRPADPKRHCPRRNRLRSCGPSASGAGFRTSCEGSGPCSTGRDSRWTGSYPGL